MKDLNSYLIFLGRNKLYVLVNLFGLSVSLAAIVLISVYTYSSFAVSYGVKDSDRIYSLGDERMLSTAYRVGDKLKERYPEIEEKCGVTYYEDVVLEHTNRLFRTNALFVDSTFLRMFSVKMAQGSVKNALESRDNILLTKEFAFKVFGNRNPVGEMMSLMVDGKRVVKTVAGVIPEFTETIFPNVSIVMETMNIKYYNSSIVSETMNNAGSTSMYLKVKDGSDLVTKSKDMTLFLKSFFWLFRDGVSKEVRLVPFKDIYFSGYKNLIKSGNWGLLLMLIFAGVAILLFAVVNYINLTIAQSMFRAKEMATRRLLGSSKPAIFKRLMVESTAFCTVAFAFGVVIASFVKPIFNLTLGSNISLSVLLNPAAIIISGLFIVLLGIITGFFPAHFISDCKPVDVVRGEFALKTRQTYSRVLITFQTVISIILIGASITTYLQLKHLLNVPLGYNTRNILAIPTWNTFHNYSQVKTFCNELRKIPQVESVAMGEGTPAEGGNNWTTRISGSGMISFQRFAGDSSYFNILGLKRKSTFNFPDGVFINEQAQKELGVTDDNTIVKLKDEELRIAGVYSDFKVRSVFDGAVPVLLSYLSDYDNYNKEGKVRVPWTVLVKIDSSYRDLAMEQIKNVYSKSTQLDDFNGDFLENQLKQFLSSEIMTAKAIRIFAFIGILISSLGLLAMSTYYIRQRKMEIAIRKVFGANEFSLTFRIVMNFMRMILIAFLLAVPVLWFIMDWWLKGYSLKIHLSPFIFILSGVISLFISFCTVYWQCRRAVKQNPVESIKH